MSELRRSRRLRGIAPESDSLGLCFICQEEFEVQQLARLIRTNCCRVLMHRGCHQDMEALSSVCGNCRGDNNPGNRRVILETDEEFELDSEDDPFALPRGTLYYSALNHFQLALSDELAHYRRTNVPHVHRPGSMFWNDIPFPFTTTTFIDYFDQVESFVNIYPGDVMYVHGLVKLPEPVTISIRNSIYQMFLLNTPSAISELTAGIRFRFYFIMMNSGLISMLHSLMYYLTVEDHPFTLLTLVIHNLYF